MVTPADYTEAYDKAVEKATPSYHWRALWEDRWTTCRAGRVPVMALTDDHLQNIRQDLRERKIFRGHRLLRWAWRLRLRLEISFRDCID